MKIFYRLLFVGVVDFAYADGLVLISKSVQGLYKQIDILNEYYNK